MATVASTSSSENAPSSYFPLRTSRAHPGSPHRVSDPQLLIVGLGPAGLDRLSARALTLLDAPERARHMGAMARELVLERFSVERWLDRTEAAFAK